MAVLPVEEICLDVLNVESGGKFHREKEVAELLSCLHIS